MDNALLIALKTLNVHFKSFNFYCLPGRFNSGLRLYTVGGNCLVYDAFVEKHNCLIFEHFGLIRLITMAIHQVCMHLICGMHILVLYLLF